MSELTKAERTFLKKLCNKEIEALDNRVKAANIFKKSGAAPALYDTVEKLQAKIRAIMVKL